MKQYASTLFPAGKSSIDTGLKDTEKASKYYSDILSGDPTKVMAAAGPEINAITSGADQQKKQITNSGNRAGGTNAATQDIEGKTRGEVADTIGKKRSGAAAGVERTGAQMANVGLGETGQAIGAEGVAGSEYAQLISDAMQSRQISHQIHSAAVEDWAKVIGTLIGAAA